MKSIVIYFSVTGNTEMIAMAIQKGIKRAAGSCDIAKIKDVNPRRLGGYDLIGIGCPIYGLVEPYNVSLFLNHMRFVGGKHAFPFATHGTRCEFFYPSIVPKMENRGMVIIGFYNCYAGVPMEQGSGKTRYPTDGHPDAIDLAAAEAFGRETVDRSRRISAGETHLIPRLPEWCEYNVARYEADRREKEKAMGINVAAARRKPKLKFDKRKCDYPECTVCMDLCPMDGIDLTVKPAIIGNPCFSCNICSQKCPTGALTMEKRPQTAQSLEAGRALFEEYNLKPLLKAEKEGRFRRLVPLDEIGF